MPKSGLNDFLVGVIHNEAVSSVLAITKKDLSAFAQLCENSLKKLSIMSLDHLDSYIAEPNDLCIIFDDMPISKTQVGLIKNTLAQKVLIIKKNKDDNDHQKFLELGFTQDIEITQARIYSYNLKTYNNKRGWNNPEGWANPENFEKFRW
ncbi:DUF6231 family protein [Gammaproteobacteria bacterium]|nr:DUF6231 family protein [Gammaproteobacteria bacterium]MDC0901992.1 DUF6231 family protein [Gammaproteobacteria bacterium]